MAKDIKFNIKLLVDGKEQLVTASTSVKELRQQIEASKPSAERLRNSLISLNQSVEVLKNASSAMSNLRDTLSGLTASYNAVQQSNTLLTTVMRQRINATDEDINKVKEVISTQTKLGVISGTVQRMGAQQIATFLKEKGTLETLIPAMNDLVAQQKGIGATGEDARGVANLMGKAMMGQTSALRRVGITFTDAQEQVMKFGNEQQRAAMLANIIPDNPVNQLSQQEKVKWPESKREYLTIDEVKKLIATPCKREDIKAAFLFACYCGLRISDVQKLRWKDIVQDGDQWRANIVMQKTKAPLYLPLSKQARKWMPERGDAPDDDTVFHNLPKEGGTSKCLQEWVESAGINKKVTFHVSRHTFATMMLTLGADLYTVSKLLGHTSVKTTQIYAKIIDQKKDDAVSLVDNIFD